MVLIFQFLALTATVVTTLALTFRTVLKAAVLYAARFKKRT
jgi:hypothetical protein